MAIPTSDGTVVNLRNGDILTGAGPVDDGQTKCIYKTKELSRPEKIVADVLGITISCNDYRISIGITPEDDDELYSDWCKTIYRSSSTTTADTTRSGSVEEVMTDMSRRSFVRIQTLGGCRIG